MRTIGLTVFFLFGLLRMKPWAILLLIGMGAFVVDARAERMDLDCEDHMNDDLIALACNVYWEGRNQTTEGMLAIASVTLWRVQSPNYPDTIAEVVWQRNWSKHSRRVVAMFSWTLDGHVDRPFKNEQEQWDEAWKIARNFALSSEQKDRMCPHIQATYDIWNMLEERGVPVHWHPVECEAYGEFLESKFWMMSILDQTDGATLYHADYVDPWWNDHYEVSTQIGNHIFYHGKRVTPTNVKPKITETNE